MKSYRLVLGPFVVALVLALAGCAGGARTPLAGGDPQACLATCRQLDADCRADSRSAAACQGVAAAPGECDRLDGDPRRACLSRQLDCASGNQQHCEVRRATCVQSCGL